MGHETHASDAAGAHNLSKYYMSASSPININAQIQKLKSLDHFEVDDFLVFGHFLSSAAFGSP